MRGREFLELVRTRRLAGLVTVRDPDKHIDAPGGRFHFGERYFDFAWGPESVLLDLDGECDDCSTLEAQALGWTVLNISSVMLECNTERVMQALALTLGCGVGRLGTVLEGEAIEDQELLEGDLETLKLFQRFQAERQLCAAEKAAAVVPSLIVGSGVGAGLFLMLLWLQGAHARERVEGREQEAGAGGR